MTIEEIKTYKQIRTPDYARLASLVSHVKGPDRTMAQFAEATGIGASTLSRLVNLNIKKPLAMDTLIKIYEGRANAEDEYLLDALARANGMFPADFADDVLSKASFRHQRNEEMNRENQMKNALIGSLVAGGHNVSVRNSTIVRPIRELPPLYPSRIGDFTLYLHEDEHPAANRVWSIFLNAKMFDENDERYERDLKYEIRHFFERQSRLLLLDAWKPEALQGMKISYAFIDKAVMGEFWNALTIAKVNNEISLILIDPTTYRVLDEIWVPGNYNPLTGVRYFDDAPMASDTDEDEYEEAADYYEDDQF